MAIFVDRLQIAHALDACVCPSVDVCFGFADDMIDLSSQPGSVFRFAAFALA